MPAHFCHLIISVVSSVLIELQLILRGWPIDSYSKWIRQKCRQLFPLIKSSKNIFFFTCILPIYMPHEINKEFWKNSHFQKMTTAFLLRCQNSLRWEICLICHWNIDSWKQKKSFGYVMVPKNNQKIIKMQQRLFLVGTITIRGAILVEIKNFISENAYFQGYFTEVSFYTSEGNQLSYFQNGYFFKILWWFH